MMTEKDLMTEIDRLDLKIAEQYELQEKAEVMTRYHGVKAEVLQMESDKLANKLELLRVARMQTQASGHGTQGTEGTQAPAPTATPAPATEATAAAVISGHALTPAAAARPTRTPDADRPTGQTDEPTPRKTGSCPKENPSNIAIMRALPEPFTRQSAAVALGSTPVRVTALFNRWLKKGWIEKAGAHLWRKTRSFAFTPENH